MNKETEFEIIQEAALALVTEKQDEYQAVLNEMINEKGQDQVRDVLVHLILDNLGPTTGLFLHREDGNVMVAFDTKEDGTPGLGIMFESEQLKKQNIPHGAYVELGRTLN